MATATPLSNQTIGDELRWKKFFVLNDGFICLVDWMGADESVTQSARVCYGHDAKRVSDNERLIDYLLRHQHGTPFEMAELKFLVRVPMDTWRQWIRHRTASVNETSTRYAQAIDATYQIAPDQWRLQATSNKQGSDGFLDEETGRKLSEEEAELHQKIRAFYQKCLDLGVAREQARKNLPLCTYTEAYWKIDLRNLLHFLGLRMDPHAQWEIRQYANTIGNEIVKPMFPLVWKAFEKHVLGQMTLSSAEQSVLSTVFKSSDYDIGWWDGAIRTSSWLFDPPLPKTWTDEKSGERTECLQKLKQLGCFNRKDKK